jgi:hypothetical protein
MGHLPPRIRRRSASARVGDCDAGGAASLDNLTPVAVQFRSAGRTDDRGYGRSTTGLRSGWG